MAAQMGNPAVTVVIPCFNHGRFVREAVESALRQQGADVRVVVVDDGSTDATSAAACEACRGERVTVIHQPNRGLPAARNRGAAEAAGEYLVFLDADDWIEPEFVARLHEAIAREERVGKGEEVSHAYCQERLVEQGQGIWRVPAWDPLLLMITNLHPVTALVRRRCFQAAGGFDETMTGGYEDWDLWLRMAEHGWRGVRVAEPLFVWRRHSATTMVMNTIRSHEQLYRGLIQRHRELYQRHRTELLVRSNAMLCQFDMHWLDEDLRPINLAALKRHRQMYESMLAVRVQRALERWWGRLRGRKSEPLAMSAPPAASSSPPASTAPLPASAPAIEAVPASRPPMQVSA